MSTMPALKLVVVPETLPKGIVVVCDGGCHNNQTPEKRVAYGSLAVFKDGVRKLMHYAKDGKTVEAFQARCDWGSVTNNQAEFKTMLMALYYLREAFARSAKPFNATICSDSELVVNTAKGINKKFKVAALGELAEELMVLLATMPTVKVEWIDNIIVKEILGH